MTSTFLPLMTYPLPSFFAVVVTLVVVSAPFPLALSQVSRSPAVSGPRPSASGCRWRTTGKCKGIVCLKDQAREPWALQVLEYEGITYRVEPRPARLWRQQQRRHLLGRDAIYCSYWIMPVLSNSSALAGPRRANSATMSLIPFCVSFKTYDMREHLTNLKGIIVYIIY